jgi:hypothetical protein
VHPEQHPIVGSENHICLGIAVPFEYTSFSLWLPVRRSRRRRRGCSCSFAATGFGHAGDIVFVVRGHGARSGVEGSGERWWKDKEWLWR